MADRCRSPGPAIPRGVLPASAVVVFLRYLVVRNLRNYAAQELPIGPGVTVLYGRNGAGKANLLEAIHLAAAGKSPQAREAPEMVRIGEEHAFVSLRSHTAGDGLQVGVGLARSGQRRIRANGVLRRRVDLIGTAPVIHVSVDDVIVIPGRPQRPLLPP